MDEGNGTIRPQRPNSYALESLQQKFALKTETNLQGIAVTGVTLDSRDVRPGDLYIGMPGSKQHGAKYHASATSLGAVAMLTDAEGARLAAGAKIPILIADQNPRLVLGDVAANIYATTDPTMLTFGVTGTNGKTSVVYMLDALLGVAGFSTGISSTAQRRIAGTAIESNLTSPESSELHALLSRMKEEGVDAAAIEVSAQAVIRHRIDGLIFDVVAFNNFSQDHLEEFGDMETYFQAKLDLFAPEHAKKGVVVVDTPYGQRIAKQSQIPVTRLATEYGQEADWHLAVTRSTLDSVSFVLQGPDNAYFRGRVPLFGNFMAENAALALIMMHEAGIDIAEVAEKLGNDPIPVNIPGRIELMSKPGAGPRFYVDYAHTPGSFEPMLEAINEVKKGRLIFMFGADGDRDTTKRADMGRIASEGSDVLIVCDYHPRFEDPALIRRALLDGASTARYPAQTHEIADPKEAMRFALRMAGEEDIILYAGPGHETYREEAGQAIPYSARDEVRVALKEAGY